ncbi:MAG: hypothetical protein KDK33_11675 [Leptospiraceae bacterium]|nr:hypothetical protein [Leptospiraceae bacterium]
MQFFDNPEQFKQVSEEVFQEFVDSLSPEHSVDVTYSSNPPIKSWNDFSDGLRWPYSVVAFCRLTEDPEYFVPEWARLPYSV